MRYPVVPVRLAVVMACIAAAIGAASAFFAPPPAPPSLIHSEQHLGQVYYQPGFAYDLPIHNPSSQAWEVDRIQPSCTCTVSQARTLTVPPRGTASLPLKLDFTLPTLSAGTFDGRNLYFSTEVRARVNAAQPALWQIDAEVIVPYLVEPPVVDLGDDLVVGDVVEPQTVRLHAFRPLASVTVAAGSPDVVAILPAATSLQPGEVLPFTVQVGHALAAKLGPFESKLTLRVQGEAGAEFPDQQLVVKGVVSPPVRLLPPVVLWGVQPVGTECSEVVALVPTSGGTCEFVRAEVQDGGLTVEPIPCEAPEIALLAVRQRVDALGAHASAVRVVSRHTGAADEHVLELRVEYFGVARESIASDQKETH